MKDRIDVIVGGTISMGITRKRLITWAGLAGIAAALATGGALQARPVTIKRDTYGVPHVYADTTYGLFYGYGHAVAEDRLYQMEMVKRSAEGTVAQVLGGAYLPADKATRSMLDPASLRAQIAALTPGDRAMLDGYAAGFNARIREVRAKSGTLMPREFIDGGFGPSDWTSYDVAAVWVGLILNRFFSGNMELSNLHLLNELQAAKGRDEGERIYHQLRWLDDPTAPTIAAPDETPGHAMRGTGNATAGLRTVSSRAALAYQQDQVARLGPVAAAGMPTASNAWVIAPARSAQGHTVLYNGPQQGWFSPSIIYGIGLHGAGFDITGTTPVGLPAVFFGTNGTIAWGSTVGALDTNDLYQEVLAPGDSHRYLYRGVLRAMVERHELIPVKGQADVPFTAYATVHGPVNGWDEANHTAYALKRSWAGHEMETLMGWAHLGQARDWAGFLKQAARVSASITWFYADGRGNIGYAGLGRLPDRPAGQPVQFPAKGDGSMEWRGALPFSANPRQLNPRQGYLVSWNNKTMPGLKGDGADYSHIDRVNELAEAIASKPRLTDQEIWDVDRHGAMADLNHRYFVPYLRDAVAGLDAQDPVRQAGMAIVDWDGRLRAGTVAGTYDGAGVTIFHAWLSKVLEALLKADLPADVYAKYAGTGYLPALSPLSAKPGPGAKLLWYALQQGKDGAPFAYDFLHGRDPKALVRTALADAVAQLTRDHGKDMSQWRTSAAPMQFAARSVVGVPWAGEDENKVVAPYRNRGSVSFRVTLGRDGTHMCSAAAPGQSGFVAPDGKQDRHYADQLPLFEQFGCKPDRLTAAEVRANVEREQRLDDGLGVAGKK